MSTEIYKGKRHQQLTLIRQKCIEANPEIAERRLDAEKTWDGATVNIFDNKIRLADVLSALENTSHYLEINQLGHFTFKGVTGGEWGEWNLRKDDLTEQSDETILFLYDLLK